MNQQRPDTPLAMTPEPIPFTVNQQASKYQATADAAINQINVMANMNNAEGTMPNEQTSEANGSI